MAEARDAGNAEERWGEGAPIMQVLFEPGSPVFEGAAALLPLGPTLLPAQYSNAREEFLASRRSASLGVSLNTSPVYDVSGPDAAEFLTSVAVNRGFEKMVSNGSKHVVLCNDAGLMLADGLVVKSGESCYRTYWLAPVLDFHLQHTSLDVQGKYIADEYFFQVDGPKSLEVMERVTGADLRSIRFGRNQKVTLADGAAVVHRLGMSGALAYEVHGHSDYALAAYSELRAAVEDVGGAVQGFWQYSILNHTVAGYPNQFLHFLYPYQDSWPELANFLTQGMMFHFTPYGSASNEVGECYRTPFDVGWGNLVNFEHDFPGKAALQKIADSPPRRAVTLEWNADDVAEVFAAQLRGDDAVIYDPITSPATLVEDYANTRFRIDYVLDGENRVGVAAGRSIAFYENRMVSLGFVESEFAEVGQELMVLWGDVGHPQIKIRARVAQFPYYNGDFRNETFDTSTVPASSA